MAIPITLELADYASDGTSPGYRATHTMDETGPSGDSPPYLIGPNSKQITPTEGRQDTNPGIPLTQLDANMSSVTLTVSVDSVAQFTVGDVIEIDLERMEVTGVPNATSLVVTRAIEGTPTSRITPEHLMFSFLIPMSIILFKTWSP